MGKPFDFVANTATFASSTIASEKRGFANRFAAPLAATTKCSHAGDLQAKLRRARIQLLTFCDYFGEVGAARFKGSNAIAIIFATLPWVQIPPKNQ